LRINVIHEGGDVAHPVILSIHPYGKDNLPTRRGRKSTFPMQYRITRQPEAITFSTLTGWLCPRNPLIGQFPAAC
jgi:hypothetical protein